MVVPGAGLLDPTGPDVAASIEAEDTPVNRGHGVLRVGTVSVAVPPADCVLFPRARGCGLRLRVRLRLRINPRRGSGRILLDGLHDDNRRRRLGSVGQGGGQVDLIPVKRVTAGNRGALAVIGRLQDGHTAILQAPGQGGILELLGQQRLEGDGLTLRQVHAEVIDGDLVLAQLGDADVDSSHHRIEDHRIRVVGDSPDVRAAFLLSSHEARLFIDIQDVDVVAGPIDLGLVRVLRLVCDTNVRLLADSQIKLAGLDAEVKRGHGHGFEGHIGSLGGQAITAPRNELDRSGQSIRVTCLGPSGLDVGELDVERVAVDTVSRDIAREIDDAAIEDRIGQGVAQVDAGQTGDILDGEGDRTAETFTGGFDVGNGGAVDVGGVGRRERGGTEGCTGRHHRAGRQGRQERPVN